MLVAGLVFHNALMAQLWDLGVRGTPLDVVAAWKEALLLVAILLVAWHVREFPPVNAADVLAAAYAIVIVVYFAIPQDVLGGDVERRPADTEIPELRHERVVEHEPGDEHRDRDTGEPTGANRRSPPASARG